MGMPPLGVTGWGLRNRGSFRTLGLAFLVAAFGLAIHVVPAHAARQFDCQISGLPEPAPGECNGVGNTLPTNVFYAHAAAFDGAGNIWVADELTNVFKFDPAGNYQAINDGSTSWGPGGISDLAFGTAAGQLYGAAPGSGNVWKINPNATAGGEIVTAGSASDLAIDNSGGTHGGDIYVAGGSIARFKPDGTPDVFAAGLSDHPLEPGPAYLSGNHITGIPENPTAFGSRDLAVDPDGNIYVLGNSPTTGQPEIFRFDPNGAFVRSYGGAFAASGAASKLAIDPTSGNLLIWDDFGPSGQTIWELDSSGELLAENTAASTNAPGEVLAPGAAQMTVGQTGRIVVSGNLSLRVFGPAAPLPRISYGPETNIGRSSIDVHATVDPNGTGDITHCEVQYGKTFAYEAGSVPCVPSPSPKFSAPTVIEAHLAGIEDEATYRYRVVIENPAGVRHGDDRAFKLTAVDGVTTGAATDVTKTSATVNGSFSDDGTPAKFYFEYGPTTALGKRLPTLPGGDAPGGGGTSPVSTSLPNLEPGTVYYYRLVVATSFGATRGRLESFESLSAPTIESFSAEEVNATSAKLVAGINPHGFATSAHFDYGPSPDYGQTVQVPAEQLEGISGVQPVSIQLEGLTSGATYHFRLTAVSAQGTVTTEDQTFTFFPPNCPNAQVRLETGSSYLPDCRAYELVSPGDAGGILLTWDAPPSSSATNPPRFGFAGVFGTIPGHGLPPNVLGDLYVSERTSGGWTTSFVGIPSNIALEQGGPPTQGQGRVTGILADRSFSHFMIWDTGTQNYVPPVLFGSVAPYVLDQHGNVLERLPSNLGEVPKGVEFIGDVQPSSDFSHVFFSSLGPAFVDGARIAPPGSAYDDNRLTGKVEVISTAPGGGGPILQDPAGPQESTEYIRFPAVSADGSRVLMSTAAANGRHLYMHADGQTVDVSVGTDDQNHGVEFNGMTEDGSEVLFSSNEPLTADDHDTSKDIFAWHEQSGTVTRVSIGSEGSGDSDECNSAWTSQCDATVVPTPVHGGPIGPDPVTDNAFGALNGEVYFYSPEQLDGARGKFGQRNLYTFHNGQVQFVTTLGAEEFTALSRIQVSPRNDHAAFVTNSRITPYDNHGFAEMYSYDVEQRKLVCVSCLPSGAAPIADTFGSANGLFMSDDGRTFFTTKNPLVDADINGLRDTYEFTDGRPQLISSGLAPIDTGLQGFFTAGLVGVSHDGADVFIASYETLVSQDHNGQFLRFYDARTGGGFPARAPAAPCAAADECHGVDSSPPLAPEITSGARLGNGGNVVEEKHKKKCAKKKQKNGRAHCKKGTKKKKSSSKRGAAR